MKKIYYIIFGSALFLSTGCKAREDVKKQRTRHNVLFICIDDLRRELGCYGSVVKTPNMDKLAEDGSLFFNHYVQVPTSGASRACMLTGHLPRKSSDLSNEACQLRLSNKSEGDVPETLFHHLRRNGYYTVGIGKISHSADGYVYGYNENKSDKLELPYSWDEMLFDSGKWETGWNAFFGYSDGMNRQKCNSQVKPYECVDVEDEGLPDGLTANLAVNKLKELAKREQPFCLAVGFFKPHLPFTAPSKYWELYDADSIPLSPMKDIPENCNLGTLHGSGELNQYKLGDEKASLNKNLSDDYARKLRHAYFACVSYVDAQVGKLLKALEETGEADDTVVVLWGDHGWHLGDLRVWGKHTLHETSLSSTLIIKAPGHKENVLNRRVVSSVDIYPTLMDLCSIDCPEGLDGRSFAVLLDNPDDVNWQEASYSYYNKGISLRTRDCRFSRYKRKSGIINELYRYDKERMEKVNIGVDEPEMMERLLPVWNIGKTFEY